MYKGFKMPKTTAERRQVEAMLTDETCISLNIKPRAARTGHNLPDAWDDMPRAKRGGWKAHRLEQYRVVDEFQVAHEVWATSIGKTIDHIMA